MLFTVNNSNNDAFAERVRKKSTESIQKSGKEISD